MITDYLRAEQELGRIAAEAEPGALAPTLIGAAHLLFADRTGPPPDDAAVAKVVATVIGGALREPSALRGLDALREPPSRKIVGADSHPLR